ncbi:MAG: aldo/keto reductase [Polyangiales bacterium]|nr:aldo/keto reductase [Myxococcales bacterium]
MPLDFGPLVLGGNVFGWSADRATSFRVLDGFLARGGLSIDTADVYAEWADRGGVSEEILGQWMAERGNRSKVVIATKVAKSQVRRGLSPANLRAAIEDSLRRLRTDYVDLYYAHEDDADVPQAAYLETFDALVKEGKVRSLGASNFTAERLGSALALCRENGWATFEVSQDHWNLVDRQLERTLVPLLEREGLVELPYWALASGFLTGKYRPGVDVDSVRASGVQKKYLQDPRSLAALAELDRLAKRHEVSVASVALTWLRSRPTVGAPIASARTEEQLDALFERPALTEDELATLSQITAPEG